MGKPNREISRDNLALMCYESTMWKLHLLGLVSDERIVALNEASDAQYGKGNEGYSDE